MGILATHIQQKTVCSPQVLSPSHSFDPMKKNIIQNHMCHKGRMSTLQVQFTHQKSATKALLHKQICRQKTDLTQIQKQTQQH
jgi:hypothetical protein